MSDQGSEFRVRLGEALQSYGLPGELAAEIENHLTAVTYEKGTLIFPCGAPADILFFLLKGFVKLYLPRSDGTATLVDLKRSGDFLVFVSGYDSGEHRHLFEAHALTRCSVGLLSRARLSQMLNQFDNQTAIRLLERFNFAWSSLFERCVTFVGSTFRERLEMVLKSLAERFGVDDRRGTLLLAELSHGDLAEMIGSSRPMVSKLLSDLADEGLLARSHSRHLIVRTNSEVSSTRSPGEAHSRAPRDSCDRVFKPQRFFEAAGLEEKALRPNNGRHG